jgi:asparagine N-glycosylation enzyme membrane subunit Stt3
MSEDIQTALPTRSEIEVLEWDDASNSFTTAGDASPDLDRLRRDLVIIRFLVLTQGGNPIAEIPNIRIKA